MFLRRMLVVGAIAGACFIAGCQKNPQTAQPPSAKAVAQAQAQTSRPAWLHAHLPEHMVAYVRIPSPWAMVGAVPSGGPLDAAVTNRKSLAVVKQLRKAAAQQPGLADSAIGPLIKMLFTRLDSPLEIALIDPTGMPTPAATGLLEARLNVRDAGQVQQLFQSLPKPALHLVAPLDAHGNGALRMGARVHFDAANKRLFVLAGLHGATQAQMDSMLGELKTGKHVPPSLARLEPGIDASGQGLFAWIKLKGLSGIAANQLPPALANTLPGNVVSHVDAAAFGVGTVHGHGRLRVVFDAPGARLLGYLSTKLDFSGLKTAGTPRWAFTVALPSDANLQRFKQNLNLDLGPQGAKVYRKLLAAAQTKSFPTPVELARMFGPEMVVFNDVRGTYTAVRLRDAGAFHAELDKLARQHGWKIGQARSGAAQVHWLSAPGWMSNKTRSDAARSDDTDASALMTLASRQRTHKYWTEDGHWLVFAEVPQALADRAAAHPDVALGDWLKKQDYPASTWIGVTAVSHGAQREAYYRYLSTLVVMGDMLGHPVDIMDLPSATRLGLPEKGMFGGGLQITPDTLALNLDYESSPAELLHGGSATATVAVAAILAAIAIPQYQHYIIRAQASEGMVMADAAKTAISEYRLNTGRFPADNHQAGLNPPDKMRGKYVASVAVVKHGGIQVTFGKPPAFKTNPKLAGKHLLLEPLVQGNGLKWVCSSPDIASRYLPMQCRKH